MPTLTQRAIEPADCLSLAQFYRRTFSAREIAGSVLDSPRLGEYWAQMMACEDWRREHLLRGLWEGEHLIGAFSGRALPQSWHLNYLALAPPWRGRGVGNDLFQHWQQAGWDRDYRFFTLDVEQQNEPARHWYERRGFRAVKTTWFYEQNLIGAAAAKMDLPCDVRLTGWESAQEKQAQFGFSQFEIVSENNKWTIGRLGAEYFRVAGKLPRAVEKFLAQLDPARKLLIMSPQRLDEGQLLKATILMAREI